MMRGPELSPRLTKPTNASPTKLHRVCSPRHAHVLHRVHAIKEASNKGVQVQAKSSVGWKREVPDSVWGSSQHVNCIDSVEAEKIHDQLCEQSLDKNVLMVVYAPWCPHCKSAEAEVEKLAKGLSHVTNFRVVAMNSNSPAASYFASSVLGLDRLPSFVLFPKDSGNLYKFKGRNMTATSLLKFANMVCNQQSSSQWELSSNAAQSTTRTHIQSAEPLGLATPLMNSGLVMGLGVAALAAGLVNLFVLGSAKQGKPRAEETGVSKSSHYVEVAPEVSEAARLASEVDESIVRMGGLLAKMICTRVELTASEVSSNTVGLLSPGRTRPSLTAGAEGIPVALVDAVMLGSQKEEVAESGYGAVQHAVPLSSAGMSEESSGGLQEIVEVSVQPSHTSSIEFNQASQAKPAKPTKNLAPAQGGETNVLPLPQPDLGASASMPAGSALSHGAYSLSVEPPIQQFHSGSLMDTTPEVVQDSEPSTTPETPKVSASTPEEPQHEDSKPGGLASTASSGLASTSGLDSTASSGLDSTSGLASISSLASTARKEIETGEGALLLPSDAQAPRVPSISVEAGIPLPSSSAPSYQPSRVEADFASPPEGASLVMDYATAVGGALPGQDLESTLTQETVNMRKMDIEEVLALLDEGDVSDVLERFMKQERSSQAL